MKVALGWFFTAVNRHPSTVNQENVQKQLQNRLEKSY